MARNTSGLLTPQELNARLTPEERKKNASKAGKASGDKRAQTRMLKDVLDELLAMPVKNGRTAEEVQSFVAIKGQNITTQEAIMVAMIEKALNGDVRAAEYIRDTLGQKNPKSIYLEPPDPLVVFMDYGEKC